MLIAKFAVVPIEGVIQTGTPPGGQNFEGLGQGPLALGRVPNSIKTIRVLVSKPDTKI